MMKRSITSLVLAVLMMMSLCIPAAATAFAASADSIEPACGKVFETKISFTKEELAVLDQAELAQNEKAAIPEADSAWSEPACGKVFETHITLPEEELLPPPIAPHGASKPSSFWNIGNKGIYSGSFSSLETATLYTNYYFDWYPTVKNGKDDGILYVNYEIYTWDQSTTKGSLKMTAFCKDCKEELASYTTDYAGARDSADGPVSGTAWFTSGTAHTDHFVYFRLRNDGDENGVKYSLYGNFQINYENDF